MNDDAILMRPKRPFSWIAMLLALLFGLGLGFYLFILDWQARPFCHKQIMFGFLSWMESNGMDINSRTNTFPNIEGDSSASLVVISQDMGGSLPWMKGYKYVPGLRQNDPGDLVLMYVTHPTRWTWHGQPPTIFGDKAWVVVPVDFVMEGRPPSGEGESSERISFEKFAERLRRTLDFLRYNNRPHWQTVVAEHMQFLNSIQPPTKRHEAN